MSTTELPFFASDFFLSHTELQDQLKMKQQKQPHTQLEPFTPTIRLMNVIATLYQNVVVIKSCDGKYDCKKTSWYFYDM